MDGYTDRETDRVERWMNTEGQTDTVERWMDTQTERRTGWRDGWIDIQKDGQGGEMDG